MRQRRGCQLGRRLLIANLSMKKISYIILASALLLGAISCGKEVKEVVSGPVTITASIADETKATLSDSDGKFAFTTNDAIKVYNGSGTYSSTSTVVDESGNATFTMEPGFTDTGSGLAAMPAGIVSDIDGDEVTFNLPTSYTYAQVGGADASTANVPCPMIASFTGGQDLSFKQAGAVVRFRITECVAGSITFTFTSKVTGSVTLTSVPSGTNDGILAANLTSAGYSITVSDVPTVTTGNFIYITLPVPVGTDPMNVGVWNHGSSENRVATLSKADPSDPDVSLNRGGGRKRGVSLTDVKSTAKFNGLTLAGDLYYIGNYNYAIEEDPLKVLKYYKVDNTTSGNKDTGINKFFFNWAFFTDTNKSFSFTIGGKIYRVPSSGNSGDWAGIAGTATTRPTANVKGNNVRYAFLTVTDLTGIDEYRDADKKLNLTSIGGLLLFPDNAIIAVPSGAKLDIFDAVDGTVYNITTDNNTISLDGFKDLLNQGCSFIPTAGYWNSSSWTSLYWGRDWYGINEAGSYWSDSAYSSDHAYALTVLRNHTTYAKPNLIDPSAHDKKSEIYLPVRLIYVGPAPES